MMLNQIRLAPADCELLRLDVKPITLAILSAHLKGGISTPFIINTGYQRPLSTVVFLRPKIKAALVRLASMVGCGRQLLPFQCLVSVGTNLPQSATQRLVPLLGGLHPQYTGVTA